MVKELGDIFEGGNMKKRIDFNTLGAFIIFTFVVSAFISGIFYNYFCTEQIAVRERHLAAVYQGIVPPKSAELVRETPSGKQFSRTYSVVYRSKETRAALMNYYQEQLKTQGYVLTQKNNELIAQKDGVIVTIYFSENKFNIYIKFDDIFQKLSI